MCYRFVLNQKTTVAMKTITLLSLIAITLPVLATAQCVELIDVHSFEYDGKTYEIVKEGKTWEDAAACAVLRGGYLAEINNAEEQAAIFSHAVNAVINISQTVAVDGGGASYLWLGGNDINEEGNWGWNGNNDSEATPFWLGTKTGSPVADRYSNWGDEPDNWGTGPGQDALGLAITDWPLGSAGQWNDVKHTDLLYFIVEHNAALGIKENTRKTISLYPNPANTTFTIANTEDITSVSILNLNGQLIKNITKNEITGPVNISGLAQGLYFVSATFTNGHTAVSKLVKH
jgi:hypothetical protein